MVCREAAVLVAVAFGIDLSCAALQRVAELLLEIARASRENDELLSINYSHLGNRPVGSS